MTERWSEGEGIEGGVRLSFRSALDIPPLPKPASAGEPLYA